METFASELKKWQAMEFVEATPEAVARVLAKAESISPEDFRILLSPCAGEFLEEMARKANEITLRQFGRAVSIFTPLYISDICTNQCRYCGFNARNPQPRRHLSVEEATGEAAAIAGLGFQHILLLTGDAPKVASPEYIAAVARAIKPLFASIGVEVYALTEEEYRLLVEAGVDSMTMFQETYEEGLYGWLHPVGPKRDYAFRLTAPERAARAGMRSLGIGALLGLDSFERDAFATGLHAWWLQRHFPGVDISVSIPRICPHEGEFEVKNTVDDSKFAQYVTALRIFLPRAALTCSSRESAYMRDHLLPLGVTRVSAGVSTAVGGRATEDLHNPGQFEISDHRSLKEMMADLQRLGYQPVLKDWEDPLGV